jgi:hypothetical protein
MLQIFRRDVGNPPSARVAPDDATERVGPKKQVLRERLLAAVGSLTREVIPEFDEKPTPPILPQETPCTFATSTRAKR